MSEEKIVVILTDIRNWVRAASYAQVRTVLETAVRDRKARAAYQMLDGTTTMEQVRVACKMSPNALLALAEQWTAMGLMGAGPDKKRIRLFDLRDFGLIDLEEQSEKRPTNAQRRKQEGQT